MSNIAIVDEAELSAIDEEQLVTMMVDDQLFGIPILVVQDIVEPDQITPVPLAPSAIAGVLNLRGRIVTVIDLRECLGAKPLEGDNKQMSVTVEYKGDLYTLLVDSIGDVRSLPRKSFDKPPATLDENLKRLCSGIFRLEGDLLVVLDVERILDEETILKTPRRTRRRRLSKAANLNKTEKKASAKSKAVDVTEEEEAETESAGKKPHKIGDSGKKTHQSEKSHAEAIIEKVEEVKAPSATESPTASGGGNPEQKALQAVEAFAGRVDTDPILSDLFKNVGDTKMLDLLEALFNSAFSVPGAPNLEKAYLALMKHPHLGDDHFVAAATAMHGVLTELGVSAAESDRIMQVIDHSRIKLLDS